MEIARDGFDREISFFMFAWLVVIRLQALVTRRFVLAVALRPGTVRRELLLLLGRFLLFLVFSLSSRHCS